jgi:hypothetical protein
VCPADLTDGPEGIDGRGTGRADCRNHAERRVAGGEVALDCLFQRGRQHGIGIVDRDLPQLFLADPGDLHCFLD